MIDTTTPAARRDASRVTTVLAALRAAQREILAAVAVTDGAEDPDVRDQLVSVLDAHADRLRTDIAHIVDM